MKLKYSRKRLSVIFISVLLITFLLLYENFATPVTMYKLFENFSTTFGFKILFSYEKISPLNNVSTGNWSKKNFAAIENSKSIFGNIGTTRKSYFLKSDAAERMPENSKNAEVTANLFENDENKKRYSVMQLIASKNKYDIFENNFNFFENISSSLQLPERVSHVPDKDTYYFNDKNSKNVYRPNNHNRNFRNGAYLLEKDFTNSSNLKLNELLLEKYEYNLDNVVTSSLGHLDQYQQILENIRELFLNNVSRESWITRRDQLNAKIVNGRNLEFVNKVKKISRSDIVFLDSRRYGVGKLLVSNYYIPRASQPVCEHLTEWKPYMTCDSTLNNFVSKQPILGETNSSQINFFLPQYSSAEFYSYVTVINHAFVNANGHVDKSGIILVPPSCTRNLTLESKFERSSKTPIYDEVFVIAQLWGEGHFHMNAEDLPRLAPYVEFLVRHANIRIHMATISRRNYRAPIHAFESLRSLGIDPSRIIYGNVKAHVVYLPKSTPCIHGMLPEMQLLAARYQNYIEKTLKETAHSSVVLIVRASTKRGRNIPRRTYDVIHHELKRILTATFLHVELFDDKAYPTFAETLSMFHRARIIIGIHGAGLVNMIYSRPGTYIIELLCLQPALQFDYVITAGILGHRYHAVPVEGCPYSVTVNVTKLISIVNMYARMIMTERF